MDTHELARRLLELDPLPVTASVDISTGDNDHCNRAFGDLYGCQADASGTMTLLFESGYINNDIDGLSEDGNALLMMFVVDTYKSPTGKVSKKTALAMMKYVCSDNELHKLVLGSDYKGILKHKSIRA